MTRGEKETLVSDLNQDLLKAKAIFVTNLVGIESNKANEIRKQVRDVNGKVIITKNTLFRLASKGTMGEELLKQLKGNNAIAIAYEDAPSVAKAVSKASEGSEIVVIKGGVFENMTLTANDVKALASLPSKPEMLGIVLNTFKAPLSAFVNCLQGLAKMKEENGDQPILPVKQTVTE